MIPAFVLAGAFAALLVLRAAGPLAGRPPIVLLRWSLAAMFLLTASAHFGDRRPDLVAMVPPAFGDAAFWVTFTGWAEIAGAVGLLVPRLAPWAAAGLATMLVAMFPANVSAALRGLEIGGQPVTPLVPRTLLQIAFLVAVLVAGFRRPVPNGADRRPT